MNIHRNCFKIGALALAMGVALPALADNRDPQSTTTRETTTTTNDDGATRSTTTTTRHYVYYSDHDIYFAPDTKTYYWQANGNWTSGTSLPQEDREFVRSRGVAIELDTDRPYERHDYVISHYKIKHEDEQH